MIKVENVNKHFGHLHVLKDVSLEINKNEIVSIIGASGAGKTTLLHIIGTIEKPNSGKVTYNDINVFTFPDKQLSAFRNKNIGFVFQFHHLLPEFSAIENIMLPAMIAGLSKKIAEKKATELLKFFNIINRKDHKPSQMSGGEQQRVAIARAIINNPEVILADEPSGNLNSHNANELHNLFLKLQSEMEQTLVIITHNHELANIANRKFEMKDGKFI